MVLKSHSFILFTFIKANESPAADTLEKNNHAEHNLGNGPKYPDKLLVLQMTQEN